MPNTTVMIYRALAPCANHFLHVVGLVWNNADRRTLSNSLGKLVISAEMYSSDSGLRMFVVTSL